MLNILHSQLWEKLLHQTTLTLNNNAIEIAKAEVEAKLKQEHAVGHFCEWPRYMMASRF